ncbi:MAG TPA: hypothetical protein VIC63_05050 [Candidatus Limnocylindria bacterium]|jgi:hypothetical protein
MNEPRGSRVLGALLLVVIIGVVFVGLWAFMSMAFVEGGVPSDSVVFTVGAILLAAVAIVTAVWLIRLVNARNASNSAAPPPPADSEPPTSA